MHLILEYTAKVFLSNEPKIEQISVVDPGFTVGGAPTRWGATDLQCVHFLAKTYAKTKEIDPVGGGHMLAAPPGSASEYTHIERIRVENSVMRKWLIFI